MQQGTEVDCGSYGCCCRRDEKDRSRCSRAQREMVEATAAVVGGMRRIGVGAAGH